MAKIFLALGLLVLCLPKSILADDTVFLTSTVEILEATNDKIFADLLWIMIAGFLVLLMQTPDSTSLIGLFLGGSAYQLLIQSIGVLVIFTWIAGTAHAVFKAIDTYSGLRVSEAEELHGLDRNEHGTSAYPDFWGVNEARDMLDLNVEQELTLLKEQTLKIDINSQ